MIDLRRLRYFVAVAEALHFGKAAAKLHISQPPLSRQIQQLEQDIGALLLRRSKRHVELTAAGEHLLVDARRLLGDAEQMGERTRRAAAGASGHLVLGFISAVDYSILPGVLRAYREAYPGVTLELRELTSDVQLRELHDTRIDAGMLLEPIGDSSLATMPLLRERLVVAMPATDPLARRGRRVTLSALATRPFILFPRSNAPGFHDMIVGFCQSAGFTPRIAQEAIQLQTIISLASAGLGVALVPASLMRLRRSGVVYRALRESSPQITVSLAWRRDNRSACLANFVSTARRRSRTATITRRPTVS
jgi:DNA-binding transcriptional LysR family regulator